MIEKPPVFWYRAEDDNILISNSATTSFTNTGVTYNSGVFYDAAYFEPNDVLSIADTVMPVPFTIEFWVYSEDIAGDLFACYDGEVSSNIIWLHQGFATGLYVDVSNQTDAGANYFASSDIPQDEWVHLALTYDTINTKLYYNNVEITLNVNTPLGAPGPSSFTNGIKLGDSIVAGWTGRIDNFKIFDYIKTDFSNSMDERDGMRDMITDSGI